MNRGTVIIDIIQRPVPVLETKGVQSERGDEFWWPGNNHCIICKRTEFWQPFSCHVKDGPEGHINPGPGTCEENIMHTQKRKKQLIVFIPLKKSWRHEHCFREHLNFLVSGCTEDGMLLGIGHQAGRHVWNGRRLTVACFFRVFKKGQLDPEKSE